MNFENFEFFWQFWQLLTTLTIFKTILQTCDNWDTDYNSYNWEPEFMTIFVTWQSRVTLDSIRNSCDVSLYIVGGKFFLLHFNVCECCLSCAIEPIAAWEKSCCAHTTGFRSKVISMINIDGISNTNFKELCWLIVWCPKEICKHCRQNILSGYVQTPMTDPMRQHE